MGIRTACHTVAGKQICFPLEMSAHHFCQAGREELSDYTVLLKLSMSENCVEIHRGTDDTSFSHFGLGLTVCHLSSTLALYLIAAKLNGV